MLNWIRISNFRCFESLQFKPGPGLSFIIGPNARGKTSVLEAVCVLLRLRSPRTNSLGELIRFGERAFSIEGVIEESKGETRLSIVSTPQNRSLKLDGVSQSFSGDYLAKGRIVWFSNQDLSLVNGPSEGRRKLLDSAGLQLGVGQGRFSENYGRELKNYDRALRSRNLLLREGASRREVEAYDIPLSESGEKIISARKDLVTALAPLAAESCRAISGETLGISYQQGSKIPMMEDLLASREEEVRLRQTRVGPQRDDVTILLNGIPARPFASEGQCRTIALSLKLSVASLLNCENGTPPLLLLDDIFGELDPSRRVALLSSLPRGSQALFSTTDLTGIKLPPDSQVHSFEGGDLRSALGSDG
jgi:DNA replication and repair protein RecF